MMSRRVTYVTAILGTAVTCFTLGAVQNHHAEASARASHGSQLTKLQDDLKKAPIHEKTLSDVAVGTAGAVNDVLSDEKREQLMADIKEQLGHEMGLLPVRLIRERQASFVELYTYDNHGQRSYGTAGYLGHGYFITVKHAVVALSEDGQKSDRAITPIKVLSQGKEVPAKWIDAGKAEMEVDRGDWAIIKTRDLALPAF